MIQHASTTSAANPGQKPGLTAFPLKVLAILGMTCNHACYIYWDYLPPEIVCILFALGGLTFPIMAFLLVEGYRHTSNVFRYGRRLFVFALISQVPYGLFLAQQLNVLFTLFICLLLLYAYDHMASRPLFWMLFVLVTAMTIWCDWGILAPCMVMVLRVVEDKRQRVAYSALLPIAANGLPSLSQLIAMPTLQNLAFALYPLAGCTATIPLLWAYNGGRGRPMKWFFYAYYPAHIAVLGLAKGLLLGDWNIAAVG